uniref:Uncharacterized protein n=1 Tax=Rhizophora mucronata TaxID=61149 RepID=A0A2P2MZC2_RHIMU
MTGTIHLPWNFVSFGCSIRYIKISLDTTTIQPANRSSIYSIHLIPLRN